MHEIQAQNQCTNSCESSTCASAFRTIRAYHDGCGESDISQTIEEGIHEFEELCEEQDCNVDKETRITSGPLSLELDILNC